MSSADEDEREARVSARERAADEREAAADARDAAADEREAAADRREEDGAVSRADVDRMLTRALERDVEAERRDREAEVRDAEAGPSGDAVEDTRRAQDAIDRLHAGRDRDAAASDLTDLLGRRRHAVRMDDDDPA